MTVGDLVFVPGVGFRPGRGVKLLTPVSAERGAWTVSIDRFVTGPDRTELVYALSGPAPDDVDFGRPWSSPLLRDPVTLRETGGRVLERTPYGDWGGQESSISPGLKQQSIRRTVTFEPLSPETTQVEVTFGGAPGEWPVSIDLVPMAEMGMAAKRLEASDTHHGVRITAHAIAVAESMTAIDVQTSLEPTPHPRFMRSLGPKERRPGDSALFALTDDAGSELGEFATFGDSVSDGRELHQVLVFPGLNTTATRATLSIPEIRLSEVTGAPVTLPVPCEMDIEFGRERAHGRVSRGTGARGSSVVRVELDDGGWHDRRRLLYAESVQVDGVRQGISFRRVPEPGDPIDCLDQTGSASEVTLECPVLELRGPWRLELPLT